MRRPALRPQFGLSTPLPAPKRGSVRAEPWYGQRGGGRPPQRRKGRLPPRTSRLLPPPPLLGLGAPRPLRPRAALPRSELGPLPLRLVADGPGLPRCLHGTGGRRHLLCRPQGELRGQRPRPVSPLQMLLPQRGEALPCAKKSICGLSMAARPTPWVRCPMGAPCLGPAADGGATTIGPLPRGFRGALALAGALANPTARLNPPGPLAGKGFGP